MLKLITVMRWLPAVSMLAGAGMVSGQVTSTGSGQDYPSKPIRILTSGIGGGSDFTARQLAPAISGPLGQQVVVDNRTAIQANEIASKAPSDGYTLLVNGTSTWTLPLLTKSRYEMSDFSPVSLLIREVTVMVVHPSVPANSAKELIALAKAKPGALNYAATAVGGAGHLAWEAFKSMAGVNIVRVSYKASAAALTGLLSNEVQVAIDGVQLVPHIKSGKLKALGVTSAEPSALFPGLPTVSVTGLAGYETVSAIGLWVPAKTPAAVITKLNREVARVLSAADIRERFFQSGMETAAGSPEQFTVMIKSEIGKLTKVIKDGDIKVE